MLNTLIQVGEPLKPAALEKLRKQSKAALLSRHHQMPPALAQRPPPADSQPASGAASALGAGAKRTSMFGRLTQRASSFQYGAKRSRAVSAPTPVWPAAEAGATAPSALQATETDAEADPENAAPPAAPTAVAARRAPLGALSANEAAARPAGFDATSVLKGAGLRQRAASVDHAAALALAAPPATTRSSTRMPLPAVPLPPVLASPAHAEAAATSSAAALAASPAPPMSAAAASAAAVPAAADASLRPSSPAALRSPAWFSQPARHSADGTAAGTPTGGRLLCRRPLTYRQVRGGRATLATSLIVGGGLLLAALPTWQAAFVAFAAPAPSAHAGSDCHAHAVPPPSLALTPAPPPSSAPPRRRGWWKRAALTPLSWVWTLGSAASALGRGAVRGAAHSLSFARRVLVRALIHKPST